MAAIQANVTNQQIGVTVGETQIDVAVSGGVGPTGPSGTVSVSAPITNSGTSTAATIGLSTGTGLAVSGGSLTVSYGATAGTACQGNDSRLSDAREWSASTVGQAEAEAGTSTTRLAYTPLRVFQAIAAWWVGSAAKTKLDGIAVGATANATDAQLRDRSTHTGTQPASTISDFTAAVIAAAPPTTNASLLTSGTLPDARLSSNIARTSDVTSAVAAVVNAAPATLDTLNELAAALGNDASFATTVTNSLAAKAPLASPTFTGTVSGITKAMVGLGNADNTSDASKPVSTAQAAADAAVASAAAADATTKANAAQAAAVQRANHTGTQAASTISDFSTAAAAAAPVQSVAGRTGTVTIAAADVSGLGSLATQSTVSYASLTGTPSSFAPSAHKSTHATGGTDALTPADIGAAAALHAHSAADTTSGVFDVARLPVGTSSTTVAAGNDARFTDARTPTGAAGGDLTGTYPNPTLANSGVSAGTYTSVTVDAKGRVTAGTNPAGGTKTIIRFTPADNQPPASNFATLDTRNSILVLEFDAATQESANFIGVIPEGATLTNGLTTRIWWMGDTATTGNVRWGVSFERVGTDNDADSFSSVTEATGAASGTSGIETVTSITATAIDSLAAGDRFRLRVARIAADATNDTMTGDAQLVAVEVQVA